MPGPHLSLGLAVALWAWTTLALAVALEALLLLPEGAPRTWVVLREGSWALLASIPVSLLVLCAGEDGAGRTAPDGAAGGLGLGRLLGLAGVAVAGAGLALLWRLRDPGSPAAGAALFAVAATCLPLASVRAARLIGEAPAPLRRRVLARGGWATAFALVLWLAARALPGPLTALTVRASDALLGLVYAEPRHDLAARVIGTPRFAVRIEPACSGTEGVLLALALVGPYLWSKREELRFPRAWLLVPLAALAVEGANVLRVVGLVMVGQRDPALALGGFHAAAGWLFFVIALGLALPLGERLLGLRVARPIAAPSDGRARRTRALLLPLTCALAAALLLRMIGLEGGVWAPARYVAALGALALVGLPADARPGRALGPWLAGLGVGLGWLLLADEEAERAVPGALGLLGYALVTPVVEELAFRGYLLPRLAGADIDDRGRAEIGWGALLLSSALFGAMHGRPLLAGAAGLVYGGVARRWGLGGAVAAHLATNALIALHAAWTGRGGLVG